MPDERLSEREARLEVALRELREARNENRALRAELGNLDDRLAAIEHDLPGLLATDHF